MENKNQSAYPISKERAEQYTPDPRHGNGLTKREYFAGLAMQGMLVNPEGSGIIENIARGSVDLADALLAALQSPSLTP